MGRGAVIKAASRLELCVEFVLRVGIYQILRNGTLCSLLWAEKKLQE